MRYPSLTAAGLAAAAFAAPAHGADASSPPTPPTHQEFVEVVATRIPEDPAEVPAAIDVVSGDELRARGATDLRSALELLGGVDVAPGGDGGPAASVPEFYGLKEFDAFLLVVDGIPWGGAFNPALASLDLQDVERIEVMRGPAPVTYGATSFVGVIHVVRRDAGSKEASGGASFGSFGSFGAQLNTPLPSWAGFDSRLTVDGERRGYRDDRTRFDRGHLLWRNRKLMSNAILRFDLDGTWLNQLPASPHPREGATLSSEVPLDANHNPAGARLDERRIFLATAYDRSLRWGTWSTTLSFTHSSQPVFRGFLADLTDAPDNARGFREEIGLTDLYFDTHLAWTATSWRFVAGLDHLHGQADARGGTFDYSVGLDGSSPSAGTERAVPLEIRIENRREFSGLYGRAEWTPGTDWRLEAGVRVNRTSETGDRRQSDAPEPNTGEEEGRDVLRLSGGAGLTWTAWKRGDDYFRLFADYRDTFKPAAVELNLEEAEGSDSGILEPETARTGEVGLKGRLLNGALSVDLSAFLVDFHNLVVAQSLGGLPVRVNAGAERFKGLEASLAWRAAPRLTWRASYGLHEARFRDFLTEFDGVPTQIAGNRLELSPRHKLAGGFLYGGDRGLLLSADLNWVGSRFLNKRNTAVADPYWSLDAGLGWRTGRWEIRATGRNLNDSRAPIAESELGDAQYYLLPARRFDVTAAVHF